MIAHVNGGESKTIKVYVEEDVTFVIFSMKMKIIVFLKLLFATVFQKHHFLAITPSNKVGLFFVHT